MAKKYDELPGWTFHIDEISANVYQVKAHDEAGRNIEINGFDVEALIEECKEYACKYLDRKE